VSNTASSYISYQETLYTVLDALKPKRVIEYGTGNSTQILALYPSVEHLTSIEHDPVYFELIKKLNLPNTNIFLRELDAYPRAWEDMKYDLAFVDGRERARCLDLVREVLVDKSVVILHDAEREQYKDAVNLYTYRYFTDDGHTAVLTDSVDMSILLQRILQDKFAKPIPASAV